mmetsp:Transcript_10457/g.18262  ORF Transcript_10457/g.18262 Transcript_10457/m.18262 type:complete len:449 (-) Transcript_10457:272-1618(-)|eukprot:CAMPEP_0119108242 /NCGR_PEP_ID=MMETSP1180-20130426/13545_1 /TAXON_ID=3052 ORGANISM="Chlamydomonas cf sp, Strain CCMP681" /NCGR_SAMPLE_ID=MMETSP1180 /ASSEMBLY_ACC=CAM_ASM_000741 /LENGTH=448 /DNA_ID=CAMNT_0007093837 /DNA_START=123 /DNA_END=1469 /DNA_ORIENTATION=-
MPVKRKQPAPQPEEEVVSSEAEELEDSDDSDAFPEVSDERDEDGGSDDEGDEDDEEDVKEIMVDFEFFGPEDKDFLGLKTLLASHLNGQAWDSSAFVNAIIEESDTSSVVKTGEDDDPIAVMAVLNVQQFKDVEFMKQIRAFLLAHCPKSGAKEEQSLSKQLTQALDSPGTGLMVNERLMNSPPSLGPPLLQFLMQEIAGRAAQDDDDAQFYQYKRYLLVTRVWLDASGSAQQGEGTAGPSGAAGGARPGKRSKQEAGASGSAASGPWAAPVAAASSQARQIVFTRPEDEFLHQQCSWHYVFPIEGRPVTQDGLVPHRLVMQVNADKVPAARAALDKVVGNMAAGIQGSASAQVPVPAATSGKQHGKASRGQGSAGAGKQHGKAARGEDDDMVETAEDIEQMAEQMFAQASAAGAGRGAAQAARKSKKEKKGKGKGKGKGFATKVATL